MIGDQEWEKLIGLAPMLQEPSLDARIDLALRRLEDSATRVSSEDKLIDYWIGLEALFADPKDELTYRYSVRIARFLGFDADKRGRVAIRDAVKESYGLRSKVAHGSPFKPRDRNRLPVVTEKTGRWLRESIQLCITNFDAKSPDLKQLDDDALT